MGAGEHQDILFALADRFDILLERFGILWEIPLVDLHAQDVGPSRFETGNQGVVRHAVFLKSDGHVRNRDVLIDQLEDFAPGVRLRCAIARLKSHLSHRRYGLRTARDGDNVRKGIQKPLPIDMLFNRRKEMLETNPCEENHQTDFAGDDSIGKVDGLFVLVDRQFSHRRADGGRSTKALD